MNHNFHSGNDDNPHRFLNVLLEGTYVRPHRHSTPPKPESFLVLDGKALLLIFDEAGAIAHRTVLGMGPDCDAIGIDLEPGVLHTITALTPRAVCYEVKPGPYAPGSDKDFAEWAPREGTPEAAQALARWIAS